MKQRDIEHTRAFIPQCRTITDATGRPIIRGVQAVIQHFPGSEVMGSIYMNNETIRKTLTTRCVHYYDTTNGSTRCLRTGDEAWQVADIYTNCNQDCLLIQAWHANSAAPWQILSGQTPCFRSALNHDGTIAPPLVQTILQDAVNGQVLFLASMDQKALRYTLENRRIHVYSRTSKNIRQKGETSGDFLQVTKMFIHTHAGCLLSKVHRLGKNGGACHVRRTDGTTRTTCFYRILACTWGKRPAYYHTLLDV